MKNVDVLLVFLRENFFLFINHLHVYLNLLTCATFLPHSTRPTLLYRLKQRNP